MKTSLDIADFYQQLALLIRSGLPLPDSLRQLARNVPRRAFQEALARIADETAGGRGLTDALAAYPQYFSPLERRLLSAGEDSSTLPEMLAEVAKLAHMKRLVVTNLRDVLAYPLFTLHAAVLVLFFFSTRIFPLYEEMFTELIGHARLPPLTTCLFAVGHLVRVFFVPCIIVYVCLLIVSLIVCLPTRLSRWGFVRLVSCVPGGRQVTHLMDMARLCNVWSIFIQRRMPLHSALRAAAGLTDRPGVRSALERAAAAAEAGRAPADVLEAEPAMDNLIAVALRHVPADELGPELRNVGGMFESRCAMTMRSVTVFWTLAATILIACLIGLCVTALFLPLVQGIQGMTG